MFDVYVFATTNDYMHRYKFHINRPNRHIPIDIFYIKDNNIIFTLLQEPPTHRRPDIKSSIVLIAIKDATKYIDPLDYDVTTFRDAYFIPKSSSMGFIKCGLFKRKYKALLKCDRFIGVMPSETTQVNFNWFYDTHLKQINFVLER